MRIKKHIVNGIKKYIVSGFLDKSQKNNLVKSGFQHKVFKVFDNFENAIKYKNKLEK